MSRKEAEGTKVVSVRMKPEIYEMMQDIDRLLKEKTNTETITNGVLFANMIRLYHKYLTALDKEEHDAFIRKQLLKALTEEDKNT